MGVPILLRAVAGNPIPSALPPLDMAWESLTSRDDGTLLLGMLKYAAWAGWALFVLSVVADVVTRLRGLPAPQFGPQQQLATQLIGAVLAIAVSGPTALPAAATPVQQSPLSQPAAASTAELGVPGATHPPKATDTSDEELFAEYRVRRGDCLWDIAWNELGEPERWPEIYQASQSVPQPDGRRLTDPDLIVTGWVLHIPVPSAAEALGGAAPEPSNGHGPTSTHETATKRRNVVTPFRSDLRSHRSTSDESSTSQGDTHAIVRTALSTPTGEVALQPSALELRWHRTIALDGSAVGTATNWRDRLSPEGSQSQ
jgi:hypothetical protein